MKVPHLWPPPSEETKTVADAPKADAVTEFAAAQYRQEFLKLRLNALVAVPLVQQLPQRAVSLGEEDADRGLQAKVKSVEAEVVQAARRPVASRGKVVRPDIAPQLAVAPHRHKRKVLRPPKEALPKHRKRPVLQLVADPRLLDAPAPLVALFRLQERVRPLKAVVDQVGQAAQDDEVDRKLQPVVGRAMDAVVLCRQHRKVDRKFPYHEKRVERLHAPL